MSDTVMQAAALIIPLIMAIVFHEVAHGMVARALGDPTAEQLGRLSFNPLRHVDLVGTVILPGMLALLKAPIFGWAKPVPINKWKLRNPRTGMMLVAVAGPGMNFVMAALAAVLLGRLMAGSGGVPGDFEALDHQLKTLSPLAQFVGHNLTNFLLINLFLGLFNLLPIPPFDGSHVVEGLLPAPLAAGYAKLRRLGMLIPIVLLIVVPSFVPGFNLLALIDPLLERVIGGYMGLARLVSGG